MSKAFTIRLPDEVVTQLKARAEKVGIGWTAYVSRLVTQHVSQPDLLVVSQANTSTKRPVTQPLESVSQATSEGCVTTTGPVTQAELSGVVTQADGGCDTGLGDEDLRGILDGI